MDAGQAAAIAAIGICAVFVVWGRTAGRARLHSAENEERPERKRPASRRQSTAAKGPAASRSASRTRKAPASPGQTAATRKPKDPARHAAALEPPTRRVRKP